MWGGPDAPTIAAMTRRHLAPLLAVLGLAAAAPAAHAISAADTIGTAPALSGAGVHTVSYNLAIATHQADEPAPGGADYDGRTLWTKWTPTQSGGVWLSSCGADKPSGAYIRVYTNGPTLKSLALLEPSEFDCSGGKQIWKATANTSYWIGIDKSKYTQASGSGTLRIEQETDMPQAQFVDPPSATGPLAKIDLAAPGAKQPRFSCWLDGAGAGTACQSGDFSKLVTDGWHTLEVRAVDFFGNEGPKIKHSFHADVAGPEAVIGPAPPTAWSAEKPQFGFTSPEAGATFRCRWDGYFIAEPCVAPYVPPVQVTDGVEHTLEVWAYDGYGNEGAPAVLKWTRDLYRAPASSPTAPQPIASTASATTQPSGTPATATAAPVVPGTCTNVVARQLTRSQRMIRRRGMALRVDVHGTRDCVLRLRLVAGGRTVGRLVRTMRPATGALMTIKPRRRVRAGVRIRLVGPAATTR
jgi:hypothetical protein